MSYQWFSFQHKLIHLLLLAAYPHKAAALLTSPVCRGMTVCSLFAINPFDKTAGGALRVGPSPGLSKSKHWLGNAEMMIVDEVSFLGLITLSLMADASKNARIADACATQGMESYFGGIGVVLTGDFLQHQPPGARPLFTGAKQEASLVPDIRGNASRTTHSKVLTPTELRGRAAFRSLPYCIILTEQQRQKGDLRFSKLINIFNSAEYVPDSELEAFLDLCHSKVTPPLSLINIDPRKSVRVVTPRNATRQVIGDQLCIAQANVMNVPIVTWGANIRILESTGRKTPSAPRGSKAQRHRDQASRPEVHTASTSQPPNPIAPGATNGRGVPIPLDPEVLRVAAQATPDKFDGISPVMSWFPGRLLLFNDNLHPALGWRKNELCEAVSLELDPREPGFLDGVSQHHLKFLPLALIVRPLAVANVDLRIPGVPSGCVRIRPSGVTKTLSLGSHMMVAGRLTNSVKVRVTGFAVGDAQVVSDYHIQGQSFGDECWIADMKPPATGSFEAASFLVMATRFKSSERLA